MLEQQPTVFKKKRSCVMRKALVFIILLLSASMAFGQTLGGSIPNLSSLAVNYLPGLASEMSNITATDYNNGYFDIAGFIQDATFQANYACHIEASVGSWTLPSGYAGNKTTVTSNSDFWLSIGATLAGLDETTIAGSFGTAPGVELTSTGATLLDTDNADGCANEQFDGDVRIDLAWGEDAAGTYAITLSLTVVADP
jgi:hypothetical protein